MSTFDSTDTPLPSLPAQELRVADDPFNDTTADVILRTSDQVNFYVYRNILSLASPFFKDMFNLPQPESTSVPAIRGSSSESHPVIDISEDSHTLDLLLHFCYPVRKPSMTELTDVGPVLLAAFKYDMNVVVAVAKIALEQCIGQDILGAFALAYRCELYDICSKAAGHFVQHPFLSLNSRELEFIKADTYRQLLIYRQRYTQDNKSSMPSWNDRPFKRLLPILERAIASGSAISASLSPVLPRDAATPFDDKAADIVLRSSDPIDFHVHGFILSFVSPVFKDMILNYRKAERASTRDGERPTIINVPEDSRTLDFVLRRCYPIRLPRLNDLDDARRVLAAGVKYGIDGVKELAENALIEHVDEDILGVWSVAVRYGLRDVCIVAARRFLQKSRRWLYSVELSRTSARQYHELLLYYKRCCEAASTMVESRAWLCEDMSSSGFPSRQSRCQSCWRRDPSGRSGWYAPSSLWTCLDSVKGALETRPCILAAVSDEVWSKWTSTHCHSCRQSYTYLEFAVVFAHQVGSAVAKLKFPVSCENRNGLRKSRQCPKFLYNKVSATSDRCASESSYEKVGVNITVVS